MPARLKDIAQELGLSVTTVSRALAGYPDVAEQTRRRVTEAAQAMGYVPNATAQRLQQRRTNIIGFVIPTFGPRFSDPFFSELLAGIGNEAGRQGYDVLISTVPPGPQEMELYRRKVYSRRVDGMVVVRLRRNDPRVAFLIENEVPFVAFGRTESPLDFAWVDVDGTHGVQLAVDHLVSLGHRRIAYLRAQEYLMLDAMRWQGFQGAMGRHGLPIVDGWIMHGDLTQRSGHELAQRLLDQHERATALLTGNDMMALGAMAAIQDSGLVIGKDLSVIGFDNIPPAEHSHPPLTTIHQPIYHIGATITDMLIRILNDQPLDSNQVLIQPQLVVRRSTGPVPAGQDAGRPSVFRHAYT